MAQARSESKATPLPGYGLPLDYIPGQEALSPAGNLFPNALDPEMSPQWVLCIIMGKNILKDSN